MPSLQTQIREIGAFFKLVGLLDAGPTPVAVPKAMEAIKNLCTNNSENKTSARYAGAIP